MKWNTRIIQTEDNHGNFGWRLKRNPHFQVSSPQGLVHDIIEHRRNDQGTWEEEVSAYGAIVAWRLDYTDNLYPGNNLIGKAVSLGEELGNQILYEILNIKPARYFDDLPESKSKCTNEYIEIVVKNAITAASEFQVYDELTDPMFLVRLENWLISWLSDGYCRAMKIINRMGYHPGDLYNVVVDQLVTILNHQSFRGMEEASIQIDFDRCWCEIIPIKYFR